jgi:hypothetical protein
VVIFEVVSLARPAGGANIAQLVRALLQKTPPPLHEVVNCPKALSRLVARMLDKEPERVGDSSGIGRRHWAR